MTYHALSKSELDSVFRESSLSLVHMCQGQVARHDGRVLEAKEVVVQYDNPTSREALVSSLRRNLKNHVRNHKNVGSQAFTYGGNFFPTPTGTMLVVSVALSHTNVEQ